MLASATPRVGVTANIFPAQWVNIEHGPQKDVRIGLSIDLRRIAQIIRGKAPAMGKMSCPGGSLAWGESLEAGAVREAKEESDLDDVLLPSEPIAITSQAIYGPDRLHPPKHGEDAELHFVLAHVAGVTQCNDPRDTLRTIGIATSLSLDTSNVPAAARPGTPPCRWSTPLQPGPSEQEPGIALTHPFAIAVVSPGMKHLLQLEGTVPEEQGDAISASMSLHMDMDLPRLRAMDDAAAAWWASTEQVLRGESEEGGRM